ncbi:MAG: TetR/AcrR family transcriptional regulator [Pseudonocardiales bacterium]|nr:TetR/AcrR family transcriptional regulator [Pseudonocardiales bacterium]
MNALQQTAGRRRGEAAEQTREKILRAAVAEFGAKGYAGARTAGIAARAGVNQQLISYYFGGKQGLLDELRRRWAATEAAAVPSDASFADAVSGYLDVTLEQPDWARLMIWQGLGDGHAGGEHDGAQRVKLQDAVERLRRRQADGEVTDELDAEFLLLIVYAVAFAPIALPGVVSGIFGVDPLSAEYRDRCSEQLRRLAEPGGVRE